MNKPINTPPAEMSRARALGILADLSGRCSVEEVDAIQIAMRNLCRRIIQTHRHGARKRESAMYMTPPFAVDAARTLVAEGGEE